MLIALTLAAAVAGQSAPPASPASETRHEVRVVTLGGPGGPGGVGGHPDMDKNDDGFVTREEFTAPQTTAFDMLDADSDGRISTEELASGRAAAHVILGGPGGAGGPMRFQLHGDGGPGPMGEGNVMMFRRGGPDGAMAHVAPIGAMGPGRNVQIHTVGGPGHDGPGDLDKDGDGKVSEAEFLAPLREAFQRLDADQSGSLEAGEHGPGGQANVVIMRRGGPGAPPAD